MRRLAGILVLAALLSVASASVARERLVIGMTQFPSTLNPMIDSMLAKSYVLAMAQRPITIDGHDWQPVCLLCTGLPTLENGGAERFPLKDADGKPTGKHGVRKTYTLKEGLFWGDGRPVTSADVVFAWQVGRHPETGVSDRRGYEDVLDIEVKDDRSFVVVENKLDYKYPLLGDFQPLPRHLEEAPFAEPREYRNRTLYKTEPTNPGLYDGPYVVAELVEGSHIVLRRNRFWTGRQPAFDEIVVRTIEKTAALEANLLSGAVDYIAGEIGLTIDQALAFEQRHKDKYDFVYAPGLIYEHIDFNLDNPVLADRRVRQALVHAVDRQTISDRLFAGKQPVAHSAVHPLDWTHAADIPRYDYDPKRAAALLDEAGWKTGPGGIRRNARGETLSLDLMTTAGNKSRELVEQVLQDFWKRVGIEIRIRNEPARVLFGETVTRRRFSAMVMYAWLSAPESLPRTTLATASIPTEANNWAGQNYTGYSNPDMDRLIDAIEVELDRDKRGRMWAELQRLYATDLPVMPLYFRADAFILPKWLKGVRPTGHKYSSTYWIEDWRVAE
jgi:peptide/nickel transport system substrate-binding protein